MKIISCFHKFCSHDRGEYEVRQTISCERNWSAHGHIQTKISNKLSPKTTEKFVYVYSNSKIAAIVRNADELIVGLSSRYLLG